MVGVDFSLCKALKSGFGILQTSDKYIPGAVCRQARVISQAVNRVC